MWTTTYECHHSSPPHSTKVPLSPRLCSRGLHPRGVVCAGIGDAHDDRGAVCEGLVGWVAVDLVFVVGGYGGDGFEGEAEGDHDAVGRATETEVGSEGCMNLEDFKQQLAIEAHGMTPQEAWAKGICIECKQPALAKCYSDAGHSEYRISALCEECFDAICQEMEEEE